MDNFHERNVDPISEMTRIAQSFLDLGTWGFRESFRSSKSGEVIYDSERCRVSFVWGGWDPLGGNSISIYYGRLHAPNQKSRMVWNGEECHCWHRFEHPLHFLDGSSPSQAAKTYFSHPIKSPFFEPDFRQKFHRRQPEWLAQVHAAVWHQYGRRLFELFDLRRPNLWQQYQQYLKELYDIRGRIASIEPALDKVC